jgi:hypothetical protein
MIRAQQTISYSRPQEAAEIKMPVLKEAIIDFGDCNTSLGHLKADAVQGPLSLGTAAGYRQLYQQVTGGVDYQQLRGQEGAALRRLKPAFQANKYWQRFLGGDSAESFPEIAWDSLVPIEARLKLDLRAWPAAGLKVKVSPLPSVLLYPFGWSTWISLLVTGEHSLEDLASLAVHFATAPAYAVSPDTTPGLTLQDLLQRIGKGVWEDVFGGGGVRASSPLERLSVITVLDKYGGAPAIGALEESQGQALRQLVKPGDSPSQKPWKDLVLGLPLGGLGSGNFDYVLQDGFGHFIWADHKLKPEGTNHQDLRCYHNNTFRSLIHGWHLVQFLDQASRPKNKAPIVAELVAAASDQIDRQLTTKSLYRNVSQLAFYKRPDIEAVIRKARGVYKLGGGEEKD